MYILLQGKRQEFCKPCLGEVKYRQHEQIKQERLQEYFKDDTQGLTVVYNLRMREFNIEYLI